LLQSELHLEFDGVTKSFVLFPCTSTLFPDDPLNFDEGGIIKWLIMIIN
jgi:hypothetical protein